MTCQHSLDRRYFHPSAPTPASCPSPTGQELLCKKTDGKKILSEKLKSLLPYEKDKVDCTLHPIEVSFKSYLERFNYPLTVHFLNI
jgi:hypothetical protein